MRCNSAICAATYWRRLLRKPKPGLALESDQIFNHVRAIIGINEERYRAEPHLTCRCYVSPSSAVPAVTPNRTVAGRGPDTSVIANGIVRVDARVATSELYVGDSGPGCLVVPATVVHSDRKARTRSSTTKYVALDLVALLELLHLTLARRTSAASAAFTNILGTAKTIAGRNC